MTNAARSKNIDVIATATNQEVVPVTASKNICAAVGVDRIGTAVTSDRIVPKTGVDVFDISHARRAGGCSCTEIHGYSRQPCGIIEHIRSYATVHCAAQNHSVGEQKRVVAAAASEVRCCGAGNVKRIVCAAAG